MGVVCFNCLTLVSKNAYFLSGIVLGALIVGSLVPLFEVEETPDYLLYSTHNHEYIDLVDNIREKNHLEKNEAARSRMNSLVSDHIALLENIDQTYKEELKNPIVRFRKLTTYWYELLALSLIGAYMNTLMAAIVLNLNQFGFTQVSYNGITLGVIGLLSNLIVAPILENMGRRRWLLIFQGILLACGLSLFLLYRFGNATADYFNHVDAAIVLLVVGTVVNAMMVPYYYYVSELFPVHLRGTANSIIQCISYLVPVATPWLCFWANHLGTHFLVGCSVVGLLSMPMTLLLKETLP